VSDWVVAIPSYKRTGRLVDSTLSTLSRGGVTPAKITIFVANEEERGMYETAVPKELYGGMVVGEVGMNKVRNCIVKHYAHGQPLVQFDDDVRDVMALDPTGKKLEPITELVPFFDLAFAKSRHCGARLWGLYPVCNAFYMKPGVTTDLRQITGVVWGGINDHRLPEMHCWSKSDIERTLQYYAVDGTVLRFNNVAAKQRPWKEPGGCQAHGIRSAATSKEAAEYLCQKYRGLCHMAKESQGQAQVKLKDTIGLGSRILHLRRGAH
jgi:hypothetical protein